ncbi:MAG: O-acetyl-ADP-ribose deacetylase [Thermodesulfobacterium sp.]|uniref:O-acetyl-ADP-ribose deacetylase n=1 Tax=Candidatus Thermodesulfobacterium syntrophicum TaxID=3060442 RepID=A0AAE3P2L6_9BACT|nr:O-acetyl-ADP-ribose deacetylase [Candidatus Thermodesulfobacterium syntrophicum]
MKRVKIGDCVIELIQGDITEQNTEAIVNAANERLIPGGGVDGAIHRKGGPSILKELKSKYTHCPTGQAVITGAGNLKAKYVIHAVGPIYKDGKSGESELLESAYKNSLLKALEFNINSISFPALSTGAYGYPLEDAAKVALKTVIEFLKSYQKPKLIRFVLWGEQSYKIFEKVLNTLV